MRTLKDAQERETIAGTTGTASTPAFYGRLFNQILKYQGEADRRLSRPAELLLSMEQGETNAMTSPFWSSLKIQRPDWYEKKTIFIPFHYGAAPHPDLKDVPFAVDLVDNPADRLLLTAAVAPLGFGRPYAAPPGVPKERIAALRAGFTATFKDPAFIDDCEKKASSATTSAPASRWTTYPRRLCDPGGDQEAADRDAKVSCSAFRRSANCCALAPLLRGEGMRVFSSRDGRVRGTPCMPLTQSLHRGETVLPL